MHRFPGRLLLICACYILPALVFASVWIPLIHHYSVPNIVITAEMIETARQEPSDSVLDEIRSFFLSAEINDNEEVVAEARHILQGKVEFSGGPSTQIGFPFDANDLDKKVPGWANWPIYFASFAIPNTLVIAYQRSGQDNFLIAAKDIILEFASYERNAWFPKGYLWNDHAIAERISVMARFWKLYRNHSDYNSEVARDLFQLVGRSAQLLAKPSHFNFATNHGIMQNIALLQIYIAFPTLPDIDKYKELALNRLHDQMSFYVNDEGVVLENSAEYHKSGIDFLSLAYRYLALANEPIPPEWKSKYEKAIEFYSQLNRPDNSLPPFGDTHARAHTSGPIVTFFDATGKSQPLQPINHLTPEKANSLYPVAGYSIWWNGLDEWPNEDKLSQTVVTWSNSPSNTHKHADEMSVLFWADGHNWWTNIGYWPYGTKGRSQAVSWAGSNAPHLVNEPGDSKRQTELLGNSWSDVLAAIDLERRGPDEYVARRQIIHLKPSLWIVIDHTMGSEKNETTTTWTTSQYIKLSESNVPGSYILDAKDSSTRLATFILASKGAQINRFKGSFSPFAGWEAHKPAPAITIRQKAKNSWAAVIWFLQKRIDPTLGFNEPPFMVDCKGPENWEIMLPRGGNTIKIVRKGNVIVLYETEKGSTYQQKLTFSGHSRVEDELAIIHRGYESASKKYTQKTYLMQRHKKATYFILCMFLLQEAFFMVYKKFGHEYYAALRGLNLIGWIVGGMWIVMMIYT